MLYYGSLGLPARRAHPQEKKKSEKKKKWRVSTFPNNPTHPIIQKHCSAVAVIWTLVWRGPF